MFDYRLRFYKFEPNDDADVNDDDDGGGVITNIISLNGSAPAPAPVCR